MYRNESNYSEFKQVSGYYLEWLCDMPWEISSNSENSVANVSMALEKGHYGLEEAKVYI